MGQDGSSKQSCLETGEGKQCILCGKCMEVCPIFSITAQEEFSPRAKYFLLQELAAGKQELSADKVRDLTGICLKCGRCANVCPQELNVPAAIIGLKSRSPGWRAWIWGRLVK
ncbi:MAG: 4Fe-4S dicluster domain-containing protein, partial [Thermodesulfobacteriota bacterium]